MRPGSSAQDRSGTVIGGRYRLTRRIGAGGMGTVYEAMDMRGRVWALKLLTPFSGLEGRERARRFAREIRALEAARSPHVVGIVDADTESEQPWLVTELLSGRDLEALLREVGRLSPATAVQIVSQVARALATVHASGHLHRDVKPSNVFLHVAEDGSVVAKLLDFGVAKALFAEESLTESGLPLGTPLYMAPEQLESAKHVDARCDVYSLGMTLYRALAGAPAFEASGSMTELARKVLTEAPAPLQRRAPWVAPELARAVHGAILRDRDARCPSAESFAEAVAAFAGSALREADLRALPAELEGVTAPPAALPARWSEVERDIDGRSPDPANAYVGTTLGGRYRLVKTLGSGGMGTVFEAERDDGAAVAVKVILDRGAHRPDAVQRFLREGRAAMKLTGAHVVQVLAVDVDRDTGTPFLVMELLRGVDLGQTIKQVAPLAPEVAARIFIQVCEGLAQAHRLGIVHRDVKPTNLFLHRLDDGELVVKLCDFGLAKERGGDDVSELTQTYGVLGTPAYMSPEQLDDAKRVDERSDLWSVGASLFEALTAHRVWGDRKTLPALWKAMSMEDPPSVQETAPWVDAELARVVQRALQKEPARRIASARELADALIPLTGGADRLRADMLVELSAERRARPGRTATQSTQPAFIPRGRLAWAGLGLTATTAFLIAMGARHLTPTPAAPAPPPGEIDAPARPPTAPLAVPTAAPTSEPVEPARVSPPPTTAPPASHQPSKQSPPPRTATATRGAAPPAPTESGAPASATATTTPGTAPTTTAAPKTAGPTRVF